MKKIILLLSIIIFISCGEKKKSQKDIIQEKASLAIKKNMNDSESYEFVSIDKIDTIVWTDEEGSSLMLKGLTLEKENRQKFLDSVQKVIEKRKSNNQFHFYDVNMTVRGNNSYGAKMLAEYYVKLDKDYNVIEAKQKD